MFDEQANLELARAYWVGRHARYTGQGTGGSFIKALRDLKGIIGLVVNVDGDVGEVMVHLLYPDHNSAPVWFYLDEIEEVLDV